MTLKLVCRYVVNVQSLFAFMSRKFSFCEHRSGRTFFVRVSFDMRAIFRFCRCDKIIIYHKSRVRQKSLGSFCGNGTSNYITNVCWIVADFSLLPASPRSASHII